MAGADSAGITVNIRAEGLKEAQRALMAVSKEASKELLTDMKRLMDPIVLEARSNASWSSQIPRTVKPMQRVTKTKVSVGVKAGGMGVDYAGLYEFGNKGARRAQSKFRHPVFGNKDVWVDQPTRPFLMPAVHSHLRDVMPQLESCVNRVLRKHGL